MSWNEILVISKRTRWIASRFLRSVTFLITTISEFLPRKSINATVISTGINLPDFILATNSNLEGTSCPLFLIL